MRKEQLKARGRYENGGKVEKLKKKSVSKVRNVPRNIEEYRAQRDAKKLKPSYEQTMDRYQGQIDKANKGLRAKAKVKKARKKIAKELKPLGMRFNYEPEGPREHREDLIDFLREWIGALQDVAQDKTN